MQRKRITLACDHCGKTFERCPAYMKGKARHFCSRRCSDQGRFGDHAARFLAQVDKSGDCWTWTGLLDKAGYGRFHIGGKSRLAPRYSYELHVGAIPEGAFILHSCDNPACVNPAHLRPGTQQDNMDDAVARGRRAYGDRSGARLHPERLARGERSHLSKFTADQVREIRAAYEAGETQAALQRRFNCANNAIWSIVHRITWKHI